MGHAAFEQRNPREPEPILIGSKGV
jgi:hypothetical protein